MNEFNELVTVEAEKRLSDPAYLQEQLLRFVEDRKRLTEVIQSQENELEALAPVKEFYERVAESDDWMDMRTAAKLLGFKRYGRNNLIDFLIEKDVLINKEEPYQKYVDRGYLKISEKPFELYGRTEISRKTVVSQKGLDYIRRLIEAEEAA